MKQTKLTSEISCPTYSCLAQLAEHERDDPEFVGSNTGAIFDKIYFVLCNLRSVRLNASDLFDVKNSQGVTSTYILAICPENCMKMREIELLVDGCARNM